ncbi:MAG TPA: PIN domain-containing protein [Thermoanaerobaculia bacterium]|nr:PIN domain-containing protein [Thermoanaerobaculia bacterium]
MSPPARVLVDTSAWIEVLRRQGDPEIRDAVTLALEEGRAHLCDLVLLELWNGAQGDRQKKLIRELEAVVPKVPTTDAVWQRAGALARASRDAGLTVPASDILIAACAREHALFLIHRDGHFDRLAHSVPRPE